MSTAEIQLDILPDADAAAHHAAALIGRDARAAIAVRGQFVMALSGGSTPRLMLEYLAAENLPWPAIHVLQVDERVAPAGSGDRNLTTLSDTLAKPLAPEHLHAMPVNNDDLMAAAKDYAREIEHLAGTPPVIDLIHLGLGDDGHTASLTPGDPALDVKNAEVTTTSLYRGHQRLTLTYPVINRARRIVWFATGAAKVEMLKRLRDGDSTIPAGRVCRDNAVIVTDQPI